MSAGIEAARLLLAMSVALFHWNGSLPNAYLAVDLFFVISGLVVARRYEAALRTGGSMSDFAVGRLIRLYPLYLIGVAAGLCSALLEPLVTSEWSYSLPGLVWRALLLIPILDTAAKPFGVQSFPLDNPAWSLWCEVLASGLFCLLCRLPRWAMAIPALLGAAILAATASSAANLSAGGDGNTVMVGLGRIGFSFFAGVLLLRLPPTRVLTGRRASLSLAALLAMLVLYFRTTETTADNIVSVVLLVVLIFPALTLCVACCQLQGRVAQLCVLGGGLSYALYILHWPIFRTIRWLTRMCAISEADRVGLGMTAAVMLLLLALCYGATASIDRPLRRYLHIVLARGKQSVPAAR